MIAVYLVCSLAFFAIGWLSLRRDPLLAVGFFLGLQLFLWITVYKTFPQLAFASGTFVNLAIALLFLRSCLAWPSVLLGRRSLVILGSIALFLTYIAALAALRGDSVQMYVLHFRNYFFNLLLLCVFLHVPARRPRSANFYLRLVFLFVGIQVSLGLAQFLSRPVSDFFKVIEYSRLGVVQVALPTVFRDQKVVTGTLLAMQNVSSFVLMSIGFVVSSRLIARLPQVRLGVTLTLCVFGVGMMIAAAVRSPIVGLVICAGLVLWFRSRSVAILIAFSCVVLLPVAAATFSDDVQYATSVAAGRDVENPVQRLAGALSLADLSQLQYTTLRRTIELASEFRGQFVFGSGPGIIFTDYSITDAFLILLAIEFGLVGIVLLILPYVYTLRLLRHQTNVAVARVGWVVFLVTLSQSVVNAGLWADFANAHFMFLVMVLFRVGSGVTQRVESGAMLDGVETHRAVAVA